MYEENDIPVSWVTETYDEPVSQDSDEEIVLEFTTTKNVSFKLDKILNLILKDVSEVASKYEAHTLTRGYLLIKYKPAQKKDPEEDYGFSMGGSDQDSESNNAYISGKQYFQQTDSTKAMLKFNKLVTKINKRYKLQNVLTADKVNALNTLNKVISEYIDNINSIIVDASSNSSLIQMIGENAKQIVEQANALIQVKSPDNDDSNPSVEDII